MGSVRDGHPHTWRVRTTRALLVALVLSLLSTVFLVVVLTGLAGSPLLRVEVADAASPPLAALATVALASAAVRTRGRTRLGWALLAVGIGCWTAAETFWWVQHTRSGIGGIVGLDDAFFLTGSPFVVAGAASFPARAWRGADRWRAVLDGLVVGGALLFGVGALGLYSPDISRMRQQLVALAYPTVDAAMIFVALAVVVRLPRRSALPLGLLIAGLLVCGLGDLVYAVKVSGGTYVSGTPVDLTWNIAYPLFALAALAPRGPADPDVELAELRRVYAVHRLPWVLVGGALVGVAVASFVHPSLLNDPVLAVLGAGIAAVFVVRQAWCVSDLGRLNARLGRDAAQVERMADAVVDSILVVDRSGRVSYANEPAALLLGRTRRQLSGRPLQDLIDPGDPATPHVLGVLEAASPVRQSAATFVQLDGALVPVDLSIGPLDLRSPSGMVLVFRDASERRAVDRMKNEFMSVISHEVRTPLTSIRGSLALLDGGVTGELAPPTARMVRIALESSDRLTRLLNDILDVERLESGSIRLERAPQPVAGLIGRAVREMSGQAMAAGVVVVADTVDGADLPMVLADADRVVQVLTNLIGNAVKFSPAGSEIRVGATRAGASVELWVLDHGRGIPMAKQRLIFDRYAQVDASDARQLGGTGLGLAICRDLVTLHGGRIWVISELGVGAEFRFTLPVASEVPAMNPGTPAADGGPVPTPAETSSSR